MKLIFSGGGTGGHIFPAITVADELKRKFKEAEILFVGAQGRMEEKIVPEHGYEIKLLKVSGLQRKKIYKNIRILRNILSAVDECKKILKEAKPDAVIGTGGFAMAPVIRAANKMKIKTLLIEGNSYPGLAVRMLSKKADKIIYNFESTRKYFRGNNNCLRISFPVRSNLKIKNKSDALKSFGLNIENKTVFIFGGSQGAEAINNEIYKNLDIFEKNNVNLIWQVGKENTAKYEIRKENIKIFEFINNMDEAYSAADLIISRAGISTIMELSLMKKPAILIPYPLASENHQEKNAMELTKNGSAVLLKQDKISSLADVIIDLLNDEDKLKGLSDNICKVYDRNAPEKIVNEILKLIN